MTKPQWNLVIGHCLGSGIWDLVIEIFAWGYNRLMCHAPGRVFQNAAHFVFGERYG
jgi:hypothetical protein